MQPRFEQFIRERQYLTNVTPAAVSWYIHSLRWLQSENPTQDELRDAVLRTRQKGLKATGCNSAIRAINAYLHWNVAGVERKCSPACEHLRVPQLKEPHAHPANIHNSASLAACELEAQAQEFLAAAASSGHQVPARYRLPHQRSPYHPRV